MKLTLRFALLGLTLLLFSCNGDSGTSNPRSARFDIGLHHTAALDTILEAALLVDGVEIDRFSSNTGTDPVGFSGTVSNIQPGRREVKVIIIRQTTSPNEYLFNGSAFFDGRQIFITPFPQGTLATGGTLSTFVDL